MAAMSTVSKTFRVEKLTGTTPESRAKEEDRVLRRMFGEDADLDDVILKNSTEPAHDIVDGRIVVIPPPT